MAMKALIVKMTEIMKYLDLVLEEDEEKRYPMNAQILYNLQVINEFLLIE
jgi:hypothetical protein